MRITSTRDFSPGTNYRVVAFGNGTNFTTATCTNATPGGGPGFSCTVTNNANGSVTVNWNNIGANGYDFIEDTQAKRWTTQTSVTDQTPGNNYRIVAFGNGTNFTTATCTTPNTPPPNPDPGPQPGPNGFGCSVTNNANGTVTVSWNNIGASGYDVYEDDRTKRWVRGTTTTDQTPGTIYTIIAFGNGTTWTSTSCTNTNNPAGPAPNDGSVKVLAAGDIGQCGRPNPALVGAYVEYRTDTVFLGLGDMAQGDGSVTNYAECYDPHFADAKNRTIPVVGNHEYFTPGAAGYIDYYGAAAGPADRLYYSTDIGNWHIVVLNGECWRVGGCGTDDPQLSLIHI